MTTAEDLKIKHYTDCMNSLERKLVKTGFDETEKQRIRDREADRWHTFNDDVPAEYYAHG